MARRFADHYSRAAQRLGYPSRSVFKLIQCHKKFGLFSSGGRVIELGCSPGGWTEFAREVVGDRGYIVALDADISVIRRRPVSSADNVRLIESDCLVWRPPSELIGTFDCLISDLAPSTTGNRQSDADRSAQLTLRSIALSVLLVRRGGALLTKVFVGGALTDIVAAARTHFDQVRMFKPPASRSESVESYIIARGKRDI